MEDYSPLIAEVSALLEAPDTVRPEDAAGVEAARQQAQVAIDTLIIYVDNVLTHLDDPKYRRIKTTLPAYERRIASVPRAKAVFHRLGWIEGAAGSPDEGFYVLPPSSASTSTSAGGDGEDLVVKRLRFARGELERVKRDLQERGLVFRVDQPAAAAGAAASAPQDLREVFPQIEGLRFALPQDWQVVKLIPSRGLAVFKSVTNRVGAVFTYLAQPLHRVWLDEAFLDFYRHNLRLVAAHEKGGLVECDLYPGGFVAGITKRPQPEEIAGGRGITYQLHLLIPTKQGIISSVIFADEGPQTGIREALIMATQSRTPDPETDGAWFLDPYGYPITARTPASRTVDDSFVTVEAQEMNSSTDASAASEERTADEWFNPWKDIVYPRSRADDRQHDQVFANHPLSRVRRALEQLQTCIGVSPEVVAASKPTDGVLPQHAHIFDNVYCSIPAGFLYMAASNMTHGKVFVRSGFDSTLEVCNVTLQPQFPDCGRTLEGAQAIAQKHVEWGHLKMLRGPIVKPATISGREGMLNEAEAILNGKPVFTAAFYLPWGDGSLEVSAVTQQGNHEEARRRVSDIVASLESRS